MSNVIVAWGSVDSDPERKTVGTPPKTVCEFRLNDGKGWHNIVAWEDVAAAVPGRGAFVVVRGYSRTRSYEGKNGKTYITEVIAQSIESPVAAPQEDDGDLFAD